MKFKDFNESDIISYVVNEDNSNITIFMDGEIKDITLITFNEFRSKVFNYRTLPCKSKDKLEDTVKQYY